MSMHPLLDQSASHIREKRATAPPGLDETVQAFIDTMRPYLTQIPDDQIGAVLMIAGGSLMAAVDRDFPLRSAQGAANMLGLAGERLYHGNAS